MTTYIGTAGHMVPVGCLATLDVTTEDRSVMGGGPGTLSPRRVRVAGPGSRSWSMARTGRPRSFAVIESLARRQARYGGVYRVTPCDALEWNMLTPQASEDLAGWSGVVLRTPSQAPGIMFTDGVYPAVMGRVTAGQTATSPRVPLVTPGTLPPTGTMLHGCSWLTPGTSMFDPRWVVAYGGLHLAGAGTLSVRTRNADGQVITSTPLTFAGEGPSGDPTLSRHMVTFAPEDDAVSAELHVEADAGLDVHMAWPSLAYRDNHYVPGRGCDQAYLSIPGRTVIGTWGDGFEDRAWTITEVGV